ncbi:virion structural protein [Cellulophaga phage phi18:3]|uniref:Structural protein n=1 Tax=Cellulophaga phage phi18:3 TaxID=1327983 RepID=R9ZZT4_9CAUD|nr:virion structural protein [Cellulophaga phage phi18:3]AGO48616.1 structural protein [Cellulophaga phage phi18:3]
MAFDLQDNNLSGISVIDKPAGAIADASTFITLSSYADKYVPKLKPKLHMANGRGKITKLISLMGQEELYANDRVQWAEEGQLNTIIKGVTYALASGFTSTSDHNLRVGDIVLISDGEINKQATVTVITSSKIFVATPDDGVAFSFAGTVSVICDFSNSFAKGTGNFEKGKRWNPDVKENFSHIIKETYSIEGSDMFHDTWIDTPDGPKWYNHEVENTGILFDNKVEMTFTLFERKASGDAAGMKGFVPQIEQGGNIANEYITDIEELSKVALRIKQQGTGCTEYTIWHNHEQGAYLRQMMSGLNAHYAAGSNYGMFNNSKDMAIKLGFASVYIDGITFHFTPWDLLDKPTLLGNLQFKASGIACLIIPSGTTSVMRDGNTVSKPYLSILYRNAARKREVKVFGPGGTQHRTDNQITDFMSECTNMLVGANAYFVVRTGADYYA